MTKWWYRHFSLDGFEGLGRFAERYNITQVHFEAMKKYYESWKVTYEASKAKRKVDVPNTSVNESSSQQQPGCLASSLQDSHDANVSNETDQEMEDDESVLARVRKHKKKKSKKGKKSKKRRRKEKQTVETASEDEGTTDDCDEDDTGSS